MRRPGTRLLALLAAPVLALSGCGGGNDDVAGVGGEVESPIEVDGEGGLTSPSPTRTSTASPTGSPTPTTTPSPSPTASPTATAVESVERTVVAENISFDTQEITVPAGAEVTITLENRDAVPHNFHVLGLDVQTEVFTGPGSRTITFTPTEPGTYRFQCDVHPTQMNGTFVVQ